MNFYEVMAASYAGTLFALITLALPLGYVAKKKLSNSFLGGIV